MTTKAEPVTIGPFIGGLNTFDDPSSIADDEVAELVNLDISLNGTLVSRPPIVPQNGFPERDGYRFLCYFTNLTDTYLIYRCRQTDFKYFTMAYNHNTKVWWTITDKFSATAAVVYDNKLYLVCPVGHDSYGGHWDGYNAFVHMPTMPPGVSVTTYKERLFIASGSGINANRVYMSDAAGAESPSLGVETWNPVNSFDVRDGDGQVIRAIYSFQGVIGIFKSSSTFTFAYESSPTKGQVMNVSNVHGIDSTDSLAEVENTLYVLSSLKLYAISNWNWEALNDKVPFVHSDASSSSHDFRFSVSVVGIRVIVRYYDIYYVFNIRNKAWTTWRSSLTPDRFVKYPVTDPHTPVGHRHRESLTEPTGIDVYYSGNYLINKVGENRIFILKDTINSFDEESFDCVMTTKAFGFALPFAFKRLMWWGAEVIANSDLTAHIAPSSYRKTIKWSEIVSMGWKWTDRQQYTWGNPTSKNIDVTDTASIKNFNHERVFVKFRKSIRFRQVQFRLQTSVDGSRNTGPFKIFALVAFVVHKQTVPKKVT